MYRSTSGYAALLGQPGQAIPLPAALFTALSAQSGRATIRLGFAYASSAGVDAVIDRLGSLKAWQHSDKRWLFSVHHGVTEPAAIRQALQLNASQVRLYVGGNSLSKRSLSGATIFHAKTAVIESSGKGGPTVFLGSSNLTSSAVGRSARNYEAGVIVEGSAARSILQSSLDDWWSGVWESSIEVNTGLLAKYALLRDEFIAKNPSLLEQTDTPPASHVGGARFLWIEAGAMSGGSRNQVEFNRELASFFGEVVEASRPVRIRVGSTTWDDRSLTHKTTTFGVDIWRLSLPTHSAGGFDYPGLVLGFERCSDSDGVYFVLQAVLPASGLHSTWRLTALKTGHAGVTSGHRAYGFFG